MIFMLYVNAVMAVLGCQLDYIWDELQSRRMGHTCERFYAWCDVDEFTSTPDL